MPMLRLHRPPAGPVVAPARPRTSARSVARDSLAGSDPWLLALVIAGLAVLYVPTWLSLAGGIWQSSDQSQGPLMLGASLFLLYRRRSSIAALPAQPCPAWGGATLTLGLAMYVVGRSQSIWVLEVGSELPVFAGLLLLFKGGAALRLAAFPIVYLLFMVPLPSPLVTTITAPLKSAVSYVAWEILFALDYPISRNGVILHIGPYLILVADACAGLTSMFSLEGVGLLYLHLVGHSSRVHNLLLAALLVPIAFCANVVRVLVLVLVTYHLGDAAGRGFLHGFAGLLLFVVALGLIMPADALVGRLLRRRGVA